MSPHYIHLVAEASARAHWPLLTVSFDRLAHCAALAIRIVQASAQQLSTDDGRKKRKLRDAQFSGSEDRVCDVGVVTAASVTRGPHGDAVLRKTTQSVSQSLMKRAANTTPSTCATFLDYLNDCICDVDAASGFRDNHQAVLSVTLSQITWGDPIEVNKIYCDGTLFVLACGTKSGKLEALDTEDQVHHGGCRVWISGENCDDDADTVGPLPVDLLTRGRDLAMAAGSTLRGRCCEPLRGITHARVRRGDCWMAMPPTEGDVLLMVVRTTEINDGGSPIDFAHKHNLTKPQVSAMTASGFFALASFSAPSERTATSSPAPLSDTATFNGARQQVRPASIRDRVRINDAYDDGRAISPAALLPSTSLVSSGPNTAPDDSQSRPFARNVKLNRMLREETSGDE